MAVGDLECPLRPTVCIFGSVQADIQHVAMLRRLPAPALSSAVELLQVVSFEERLGTVAPDGWAGSRAVAASHDARDEQRLLCALSLFTVCDDSLASVFRESSQTCCE